MFEKQDDIDVMQKRLHTIESRIKMLEITCLDISVEVSSVKAIATRLNAKLAVDARESGKKMPTEKDIIDFMGQKLKNKEINKLFSEVDADVSKP